MEYLVSLGAPREKLLVGIPLYGQTFTLSQKTNHELNSLSKGPGDPGEYTKQPGMLSYYEICNRIKTHRWMVSKSDKASGAYAYKGDQWVGYEDVDTVREKVISPDLAISNLKQQNMPFCPSIEKRFFHSL